MSLAVPDCPFCRWSEDPDQRLVLRHASMLFLQNPRQQGALFGSGVIIPVRHAETVFDLTPDEVSASFELLAEVKRWMDDTYQPQGYNVGWNCWPVGGQLVMHAHMHVIPRFEQEAVRRARDSVLAQAGRESLVLTLGGFRKPSAVEPSTATQ